MISRVIYCNINETRSIHTFLRWSTFTHERATTFTRKQREALRGSSINVHSVVVARLAALASFTVAASFNASLAVFRISRAALPLITRGRVVCLAVIVVLVVCEMSVQGYIGACVGSVREQDVTAQTTAEPWQRGRRDGGDFSHSRKPPSSCLSGLAVQWCCAPPRAFPRSPCAKSSARPAELRPPRGVAAAAVLCTVAASRSLVTFPVKWFKVSPHLTGRGVGRCQ